ncbi:MAG: c-type cytochrome [Thiobacillus sp.]|nr:c-type cytochrome [Thiobacillus sp.]
MKKAVMYALTAASLCAAHPALAVDNVQGLAMTCNNCHGTGGVSVGLSMPSIAGLSESYLKNIMTEWKTGARASANMTRLIKGYTDDEIAALAQYYSKLPWKPAAQSVSADILAKGKEVTERCETCHGATGGQPDDADTPMLAGQWAKYMELELLKYRDEGFQMTHKKMTRNARKMEEGDVATAAKFHGAHSK